MTAASAAVLSTDRGIASVSPAVTGAGGMALIQAVPASEDAIGDRRHPPSRRSRWLRAVRVRD